MIYAVRGYDKTSNTAVCKAIVEDARMTEDIQDLEQLGYQFVSKEEYDAINLPAAFSAPTLEQRMDALESAIERGLAL